MAFSSEAADFFGFEVPPMLRACTTIELVQKAEQRCYDLFGYTMRVYPCTATSIYTSLCGVMAQTEYGVCLTGGAVNSSKLVISNTRLPCRFGREIALPIEEDEDGLLVCRYPVILLVWKLGF